MQTEAAPRHGLRLTDARAESRRGAALALVVAAQIAVFGMFVPDFARLGTITEVARGAVEIALLAIALGPVLAGRAVDFSQAAVAALAAAVFGLAVRIGLGGAAAAALALALGAASGGLCAWLVARLGAPAALVTLGAFGLWRGLAEHLGGLARTPSAPGPGADFLELGRGTVLGGIVPTPIALVALVAALYAMAHAWAGGRAAPGSASANLRAWLSARWRLALALLASGFLSALAGLVHVARTGHSVPETGAIEQVQALAAAVLGGAVLGGRGKRGTLDGILLGAMAVALLARGFAKWNLPEPAAGALLGFLLAAGVAAGRPRGEAPGPPARDDPAERAAA